MQMGLRALQKDISNAATSDPPPVLATTNPANSSTINMNRNTIQNNIQLPVDSRNSNKNATPPNLHTNNNFSKDNRSLASSFNKNMMMMQDDKIFTTSKNDIKVESGEL